MQTKARSIRVVDKIGFSDHPMLAHFKFLKAHTRVTPNDDPEPERAAFPPRRRPGAVAKSAYRDHDAIFDDLARGLPRGGARALRCRSCRYLQFDDTAWAYLCSDVEMKKARDRGMSVERLQETYAALVNKSLEGKPADMAITTHVCRGNFRSTWIASGGLERWPGATSLALRL